VGIASICEKDAIVRARWQVGLGCILLLAGVRAEAESNDVEGLVRQGVAFRRDGKDREALDVFRRAAAIERTPHVLGQMGLAEQALWMWVEADADLHDALAKSDDPWIRKNHDTLEEALKVINRHVGGLIVGGNPKGAEILVNGRVAGTLPTDVPLRVLVGSATLTVRAKGYEDVSRTIDVRADGQISEQVELTPLPSTRPAAVALAAPPPAPPTTTSAVEASLEAKPSPPTEPASDAEAAPFYERWWFWTAVGVVAAGAITTAVVLVHDKKSTCTGTCSTWGGGN
jgi:hypothetical protein